MTRFEERGVELQQEARSARDAERKFNYSCDLCSSRGLRIECGMCAIQAAYNLASDYFKAHNKTVLRPVVG